MPWVYGQVQNRSAVGVFLLGVLQPVIGEERGVGVLVEYFYLGFCSQEQERSRGASRIFLPGVLQPGIGEEQGCLQNIPTWGSIASNRRGVGVLVEQSYLGFYSQKQERSRGASRIFLPGVLLPGIGEEREEGVLVKLSMFSRIHL